jgi:hypothetical protein
MSEGSELVGPVDDWPPVVTSKCREAQHGACSGKRGCECYCHRQIPFPGLEDR